MDSGRSFAASDIGSGCGEYFLRGVGMVTVSGRHVSSGVSDRLTHNRETMEVTLVNLARAARAAGAPGR